MFYDVIEKVVYHYIDFIESEYLDRINNPFCRTAERIVTSINTSKNYRIGFFEMKKPEYGFIGTVFCGARYLNKDLSLFNEELCICRVNEGPKGLRASEIEEFSYNGCKAIMGEYFSKFHELLESSWNKNLTEEEEKLFREEEERLARKAKWAAEKAARDEAIKKICGGYRENIIRHDFNYGGHHYSDFSFEKEITVEEFKKILQLLHHTVEAKITNLPIRDEEVKIYGQGKTWHYRYTGSWTD